MRIFDERNPTPTPMAGRVSSVLASEFQEPRCDRTRSDTEYVDPNNHANEAGSARRELDAENAYLTGPPPPLNQALGGGLDICGPS